MPRALRARLVLPLVAVALSAGGCQDYNFNPVGHCVIQPGQKRVTLSNLSTADVLFVVDDSGSMGGEQQKLADNFDRFIQNLDETNQARVHAGLEPIDFHLAITTTSVFIDQAFGNDGTCRSDCPGAGGALVCCELNHGAPYQLLTVPKRCTAASQCASGYCGGDCVGFLGEQVCCNPTTKVVGTSTDQQPIPCSTAGARCGDVQTHYRFYSGCTPGVATNGGLYPHGAFVGLGNNPRVLHFDKELYPADPATYTRPASLPPCSDASQICNRQGYTAAQLKDWFKQNILVGTCGSGEEQALQAARLAIQKAVAGQQADVSPAGASIPAEWPHASSKLVTVFVGDEDDCSSPEDPVAGLIQSGLPGENDTCTTDVNAQRYPVSQLVEEIASLAGGRPLGAAVIASAVGSGSQESCTDDACQPGICCDFTCTGSTSTCTTETCGGQASGTRLLDAAARLKATHSADVVAGSICDPSFGTILNRIAEVVKPPSGLVLPSLPAGTDITVVRVADAAGKTVRTCRGPAPAGTDLTTAAATYDWWFTASRDQVTDAQKAPTGVTQFIYINHVTGHCEANPGQTYSADYLGRMPPAGCTSRAGCSAVLGGTTTTWTCYAGGDASTGFVPPTADAPGTCVCGDLGAGSF